MSKKAVLIIMDGYGLAAPSQGNAVYVADTPNLDRLFAENPHTCLQASGLDVGLPEGQMGNSEVGHTNMGAGRVVFQILPKMTQEIKNGKFFRNPVYLKAIEDAKAGGHALHIMGLMSDGGVHSHLTHVFAMLDMAKQHGVEKVYVHCFLDGRDHQRRGLRQAAQGEVRCPRQREDRHRPGPLLGHGPRQALGPRGEGLQRHRLRRGRAGPRSRPRH